jgi:raffinose/stachyose/melibiose transport system substrate-binding protein
MPDIWFNWGGSLASAYNQAGLALDLTPRIKELKLDETLIPTAISLAEYDGKLYGVPNRLVSMSIFYRKDMLEKVGAKEPTSFGELEAACERLKAAGITPFSLGGKYSWMTMRFTDFFIEHFAGTKLHDDLMNMRVSWDNEAVVKGFAKLKEWQDKGYFNKGFLNVDPATDMQALYAGQAAMVFEVSSIDLRLKREKIDPNTYGTFPAPSGQTPKRVSGFQHQLQISAKAAPEVQDAAILFATFVVRPDVAAANIGSIGGPSAVKGVMPGADTPNQRLWADWLQGEVSLYLPTDQALPQEIVASFFEAQDSVVLGSMTPKDAAKQIQDAIVAWKKRKS